MLLEERDTEKAERQTVLSNLFDDLICEEIEDPSHPGDGTDNMTAILVEFTPSKSKLID